MKIKYILYVGAIVALSSCSTAYRSGQTPDDVYYSPAPVQSSYVSTVADKDQNSYSYRNDEDADIGRGIQNPSYRTPITLDLGFGYNPYGYTPFGYSPYLSNSLAFGNSFYGYDPYGYMGMGMYNPYMYNSFGYGGLGFYNPYNSFYNPYSIYNYPYYGYGHNSSLYYPLTGNINTNTGARRYNLNPYTNNRSGVINNGNTGVRGSNSTNTAPSPAPIRRSSGVGNVIRRVFTPNRNNRNNYVDPSNNNRSYNNSNNNRTFNNEVRTPSRDFNSSPSVSTPSSSGNSNSSAPVRTFRR